MLNKTRAHAKWGSIPYSKAKTIHLGTTQYEGIRTLGLEGYAFPITTFCFCY